MENHITSKGEKEQSVIVATNSIIIAEELRDRKNVSLILLGGEMDNPMAALCERFRLWVRYLKWMGMA